MDDQLREKILGTDQKKMALLAKVCSRYPNVEMELLIEKHDYKDGDIAELNVRISRPDVEDEDLVMFNQPAYAQYYPEEKEEHWWVVVGQPKLNKLLSIKKVSNFKAQREIITKLNFVVKKDQQDISGEFKVYLICDSYIGCDQEDSFKLKIQ